MTDQETNAVTADETPPVNTGPGDEDLTEGDEDLIDQAIENSLADLQARGGEVVLTSEREIGGILHEVVVSVEITPIVTEQV